MKKKSCQRFKLELIQVGGRREVAASEESWHGLEITKKYSLPVNILKNVQLYMLLKGLRKQLLVSKREGPKWKG